MPAPFLDDIRDRDMIAPRRLAERLRLTQSRLAQLARVPRATMSARPGSPTVQARLGEIAHIIARAAELSGDEGRAVIWFRHQTIPGFGRTAQELVEQGHADAAMRTLESMDEGASD